MTPEDLPLVGPVFQAGSSDHTFDVLMLLGPLLILGIAVVGRTVVTTGLAAMYVVGFILYVGYKATA